MSDHRASSRTLQLIICLITIAVFVLRPMKTTEDAFEFMTYFPLLLFALPFEWFFEERYKWWIGFNTRIMMLGVFWLAMSMHFKLFTPNMFFKSTYLLCLQSALASLAVLIHLWENQNKEKITEKAIADMRDFEWIVRSLTYAILINVTPILPNLT